MNKIFTKNIYTNYKHVCKMNSLAFLKDFAWEYILWEYHFGSRHRQHLQVCKNKNLTP